MRMYPSLYVPGNVFRANVLPVTLRPSAANPPLCTLPVSISSPLLDVHAEKSPVSKPSVKTGAAGVCVGVAVGAIGVSVEVGVGTAGVSVGVAVGAAGVSVGVAVGATGVSVGVAVAGAGVLVGVAGGGAGVSVGVEVGGTGVFVRIQVAINVDVAISTAPAFVWITS